MKIKMYGLLYIPKKKLLGFWASSNNAEDCVDVVVEFELNSYSENVWLVSKKEVAEKAKITNTPWFNANYETPKNEFKAEDLKVVKITMEVEE